MGDGMKLSVAAILSDPRARVITFTEKGQWKYAVRYTDRQVDLTVRPVEQRGLNTREAAGYAGLAWIDEGKAMLGIGGDAA